MVREGKEEEQKSSSCPKASLLRWMVVADILYILLLEKGWVLICGLTTCACTFSPSPHIKLRSADEVI